MITHQINNNNNIEPNLIANTSSGYFLPFSGESSGVFNAFVVGLAMKWQTQQVIGVGMPFSVSIDMSAIPMTYDPDGEPVFQFNRDRMPVADVIDVVSSTLHGPTIMMLKVTDPEVMDHPDVNAALERASARGRPVYLVPAGGY